MMARQFTNKLLEMIDDGLLSNEAVVSACLCYMSESDVKDMMYSNEFIEETEGD
jgi:hypothetical protein